MSEKLKRVWWSYGGDMSGSNHTVTLTSRTILSEKQQWHHDKVKRSRLKVSADELRKINAWFEEYEMAEASTRPASDLICDDGGSESLTFEFPDFCLVTVNPENQLTEKEEEGYKKIKDHLMNLADEK